MSDSEPIPFSRTAWPQAGSVQQAAAPGRARPGPTCFNRRELNQLLSMYGRKVAAGEWRDYAIDMHRERAVFSVFRRSSEWPLYRVVKNPRLARRQGVYAVLAPTGLILKRGHDLRNVLRVIDRELRVVEA